MTRQPTRAWTTKNGLRMTRAARTAIDRAKRAFTRDSLERKRHEAALRLINAAAVLLGERRRRAHG